VAALEAGSDKDAIVAQGHKELGLARERFVGACTALGDLMDPTCFAETARRQRQCRELTEKLDHLLYDTPRSGRE
jgi:hypothetical protein